MFMKDNITRFGNVHEGWSMVNGQWNILISCLRGLLGNTAIRCLTTLAIWLTFPGWSTHYLHLLAKCIPALISLVRSCVSCVKLAESQLPALSLESHQSRGGLYTWSNLRSEIRELVFQHNVITFGKRWVRTNDVWYTVMPLMPWYTLDRYDSI